jgi:hypothetical protein
MPDVGMMRASQKMARAEVKSMADRRAMEEQMERMNPLSGRGATPSMGLSQVRGGKKMMSNAAAQGKMLMEHLGSLHGSGYAKEFHNGMCGAGFFGDLGIPIVSDVAGMFGLGKNEVCGGLRTGEYEGEGRFSDLGHSVSDMLPSNFSSLGHSVSDIAGMFGLGKLSAAEKKALKSVLAKHEMDGKGAVSDIGHKLSDMLPENYSQFGHTVSNLANKYLGLGKPMKGGFLGMAMLALPLISKLLGAGKMSQEAHDAMKEMIEDHEKKYHSGKMKGGFMGLAMMALPLISKLLGAGHMTKGAADQLKKMMKKGDMEGSGRAVGAGHCDGGRMGPVPYGRPQRPVMELMDGGMRMGPMPVAGPGGINYDHAPKHDYEGNPVDKYGNVMKAKGKVKRVVGAGDGRRKRAEVVRKVMADKGMKMIEASKYVKEHGLYKP